MYLSTMDYHTVVIDEGIVEEKLGGGGQHFSDTIRHKSGKGGSFNFFRSISGSKTNAKLSSSCCSETTKRKKIPPSQS